MTIRHGMLHYKRLKGESYDAIYSKHGTTSTCGSNRLVVYSQPPLYHRSWFSFFRSIPPVRFHNRAIKGLDKLQNCGSVQWGDTGFKELSKTLRENHIIEGDIQKVSLLESSPPFRKRGLSPDIVRNLVIEKDGKSEIIKTDIFDPTKPIRELRQWIEEIFRRHLAYYSLIFLVVWLILNLFIISWFNFFQASSASINSIAILD